MARTYQPLRRRPRTHKGKGKSLAMARTNQPLQRQPRTQKDKGESLTMARTNQPLQHLRTHRRTVERQEREQDYYPNTSSLCPSKKQEWEQD